MKEFLQHFVPQQKGDVLDVEGNVIGEHDGAVFVTLGQRSGFRLQTKDTNRHIQYVVEKDVTHNTVTVAEDPTPKGIADVHILLEDVNWIQQPVEDAAYSCEIRYHGTPLECFVQTHAQVRQATLTCAQPVLVARGQSVVVYDNDICLGGGVVTST